MTYTYQCEACGENFTVRAILTEKERGLAPHCPLCGSRNVVQGFAGVGIARTTGSGGGCCGPSSRGGCCG